MPKVGMLPQFEAQAILLHQELVDEDTYQWRLIRSMPLVPALLHVVALFPTVLAMLAAVDEDEKVVDLSPTSTVDKEEVVDRLEPHLRLQMDVRILSPEVNAIHLHNRFHSYTCLESPTRGLLVRTIKSCDKIVMSYNVWGRECTLLVFHALEI